MIQSARAKGPTHRRGNADGNESGNANDARKSNHDLDAGPAGEECERVDMPVTEKMAREDRGVKMRKPKA